MKMRKARAYKLCPTTQANWKREIPLYTENRMIRIGRMSGPMMEQEAFGIIAQPKRNGIIKRAVFRWVEASTLHTSLKRRKDDIYERNG